MLDRLASVAAFMLPLALYVATLAPTVTLEDSGEFIAGALHLGVVHPPGYPLWCLLAHASTKLPFGSVAERVHLASAVFAAGATWLTFFVARRWTAHAGAALVAALALAASRVLWSQAVIAEVYTLAALFAILLLALAVRFEESRDPRWLLALSLVAGLSLANHPTTGLELPVLAFWLLALHRGRVLAPRMLAAGGALFALGLSVYLYLPLRARSDPPVNVGSPTTLAKTIEHVSRAAYRDDARTQAGADLEDVTRHAAEAWLGTARAFGPPLALLSLAGAVCLFRERRDLFAVTLGIALLNTVGVNLVARSEANAWGVFVHRVFYLPTHVVAALWLAFGARRVIAWGGRRGVAGRSLAGAVLAALVIAEAALNLPHAGRRGDERGRNFALDLVDSAPYGSGFLPLSDEVVYSLVYLRWVEEIRRDVRVLDPSFGWKQESVAAVLSDLPLGEALRHADPRLEGYAALPRGLAYQIVPKGAAPPAGWASFTELPHPPRDAGLEAARGDRFLDAVKARYAAYHARLGAKQAAAGDLASAHGEFARAEALNPDDAFVGVLLFEIYRDFGLHRERWEGMLRDALADHDRNVDPAIDRYYPLTRAEIERLLEGLREPTRGLSSPRRGDRDPETRRAAIPAKDGRPCEWIARRSYPRGRRRASSAIAPSAAPASRICPGSGAAKVSVWVARPGRFPAAFVVTWKAEMSCTMPLPPALRLS